MAYIWLYDRVAEPSHRVRPLRKFELREARRKIIRIDFLLISTTHVIFDKIGKTFSSCVLINGCMQFTDEVRLSEEGRC